MDTSNISQVMLGARIRKIRKEAMLTQAAFAEKIGLSKSAVEKLEYGKTKSTDQTHLIICDKFNIDENWLKTGEGQMYRKAEDDVVLVNRVLSGNDEFAKAIIRVIAKEKEGLEAVHRFFEKICAELQKA